MTSKEPPDQKVPGNYTTAHDMDDVTILDMIPHSPNFAYANPFRTLELFNSIRLLFAHATSITREDFFALRQDDSPATTIICSSLIVCAALTKIWLNTNSSLAMVKIFVTWCAYTIIVWGCVVAFWGHRVHAWGVDYVKDQFQTLRAYLVRHQIKCAQGTTVAQDWILNQTRAKTEDAKWWRDDLEVRVQEKYDAAWAKYKRVENRLIWW